MQSWRQGFRPVDTLMRVRISRGFVWSCLFLPAEALSLPPSSREDSPGPCLQICAEDRGSLLVFLNSLEPRERPLARWPTGTRPSLGDRGLRPVLLARSRSGNVPPDLGGDLTNRSPSRRDAPTRAAIGPCPFDWHVTSLGDTARRSPVELTGLALDKPSIEARIRRHLRSRPRKSAVMTPPLALPDRPTTGAIDQDATVRLVW